MKKHLSKIVGSTAVAILATQVVLDVAIQEKLDVCTNLLLDRVIFPLLGGF